MYLTDRIELIGGRIVAAGSEEGSFQLLQILLESWTAHAALGFVISDFEPWIAALSAQFQVPADEILNRVSARKPKPIAGRMNAAQLFPDDWPAIRRMLKNLFMSASQSNLWFARGPGQAVKIGDDAPTPDFVIAQGQPGLTIAERHLEGVPEIVVETVGPYKDFPRLLKLYADHGIPEVWLVDLAEREFRVLENRGGYYEQTSRLSGKVYHSVAVSGLVLNIDLLWDIDASPESMLGAVLLNETGHNSIINYSRIPDHRAKDAKAASVRQGQIPFEPRIDYDPNPITFEQFISWSPEPRFEIDGNRLMISSRAGSRNMIGMLLQNIGLKDAVSALPLEDWVAAIAERNLQIESANHIKKFLALEAQRAGQVLRDEFGRKELRTFGWLDEPPGIWTSVKIVDMHPENGGMPYREIQSRLRERFDEGIEFVGFQSLTPADRRLFELRSLTL